MHIATYHTPYPPHFDPIEAVGLGEVKSALHGAFTSEDARPYRKVLMRLPASGLSLVNTAHQLLATPRARTIHDTARQFAADANYLTHLTRGMEHTHTIRLLARTLERQAQRLHQVSYAKLKHDAVIGQHPFHPPQAADFKKPHDPMHLLGVIFEPGWYDSIRKKFGPGAADILRGSLDHLWVRSWRSLENLKAEVSAVPRDAAHLREISAGLRRDAARIAPKVAHCQHRIDALQAWVFERLTPHHDASDLQRAWQQLTHFMLSHGAWMDRAIRCLGPHDQEESSDGWRHAIAAMAPTLNPNYKSELLSLLGSRHLLSQLHDVLADAARRLNPTGATSGLEMPPVPDNVQSAQRGEMSEHSLIVSEGMDAFQPFWCRVRLDHGDRFIDFTREQMECSLSAAELIRVRIEALVGGAQWSRSPTHRPQLRADTKRVEGYVRSLEHLRLWLHAARDNLDAIKRHWSTQHLGEMWAGDKVVIASMADPAPLASGLDVFSQWSHNRSLGTARRVRSAGLLLDELSGKAERVLGLYRSASSAARNLATMAQND